MPNSLLSRLLLSSIVWSLLGLFIAGFLLTGLYRNTVERAFDERLDVYLKVLIGEISIAEDLNSIDDKALAEPRFSLVLSGWYWTVAERDGTPLATSASLFAESFPVVDLADFSDSKDGVVSYYASGPSGKDLRIVGRNIEVANQKYSVLVAGDASQIAADITLFRNRVLLMLAALGAFLALSTFLQVKWGLRPLQRITEGLNEIRDGKSETLTGKFPKEISPLVSELNALISFNQKVIERARTHVGNLAHALKTPLSVLRNEAGGKKSISSTKVDEQINVMQSQVSYHLDRARIVARTASLSASHPLQEIIGGLVRVMEKVYRDKNVRIDFDMEEGLVFSGERQDMEEIFGNLIDNAFKWCASNVRLSAYVQKSLLIIEVEDDGPGLTTDQRQEAVKRGKRLDENTPGTGLGLSIVTDLIDAYDGEFVLQEASIGGLKAVVKLPVAHGNV